ncbi:hypothetical protein C7271_20140 [filamentous cyanobacterium CCP5]|nr:hypothetical protein C7271_20140 [filamentous cyanobacterium CCP5]
MADDGDFSWEGGQEGDGGAIGLFEPAGDRSWADRKAEMNGGTGDRASGTSPNKLNRGSLGATFVRLRNS